MLSPSLVTESPNQAGARQTHHLAFLAHLDQNVHTCKCAAITFTHFRCWVILKAYSGVFNRFPFSMTVARISSQIIFIFHNVEG